MSLKSVVGVQAVLLVIAMAGLVWTNGRLRALNTRVQSLEHARQHRGPGGLQTDRPHRRGPGPSAGHGVARGRQASVRPSSEAQLTAEQASPNADILWTEDGRAAIDDVLTEREERRAEMRTERWQQMRELRIQRAVDRAVQDLELSDDDAASLQAIMTTFSEARGDRWRKMHDGDADPAKLLEEGERARERFETELVDLLGEDGAEQVRGMMRGPGL